MYPAPSSVQPPRKNIFQNLEYFSLKSVDGSIVLVSECYDACLCLGGRSTFSCRGNRIIQVVVCLTFFSPTGWMSAL